MIKWIRGRLFSGNQKIKNTGHIFECGDRRINFKNFDVDTYPPFDCLKISLEEAIQFINWLDEVMHAEKAMKFAKSFHYYYRSSEECPFNRGNWILDIEIKTGENSSKWICFKFPKEMIEEEFIKFLNPLFKMKRFKKLTSDNLWKPK